MHNADTRWLRWSCLALMSMSIAAEAAGFYIASGHNPARVGQYLASSSHFFSAVFYALLFRYIAASPRKERPEAGGQQP